MDLRWSRSHACVLTTILTGLLIAVPATDASAGPESTYNVGILMENGWDVALGPDGSAVVTGSTDDRFQATPGAVNQPGEGLGTDAFVLKVDATGRVAYSAVLGGAAWDEGTAVAVAGDGSVYVAGKSAAHAFPTTSGVIAKSDRVSRDDGTAFLAKLSPDGSELEWSTLLPGVRTVADLTVDQMGRSHLVGNPYQDLPVSVDAFDKVGPTDNDSEGFFGTVNQRGTAWVGASYLGGDNGDSVSAIELAPDGGAYVSGRTISHDFPSTPGTFDPDFSGRTDAFVAKVTSDGSQLVWSTFLGGEASTTPREWEEEGVERLAVDRLGRVLVEGYSNNDDFPTTPGAAYPTRPRYFEEEGDSFVARITPDGTQLDLATFLPGFTTGVGVDAEDHLHLVASHAPGDEPGSPIGSPSFVDLELDEIGAIVDLHPVPGVRPLDFDVDAAGTLYVLGTPWPDNTSRGQRALAGARMPGAVARYPACTIRGTNGSDVLRGTRRPDVICAGPGDDVISGLGGQDVVRAGPGGDRIFGGRGIDVLSGGSGSDRLNGSWRRDLLIGGIGADIVTGGSGSDSLRGGAGRDRLRGGEGPDGLRGGSDADSCFGGLGRDRLLSCES